jgi:hypothetical protein
VVSVIDCTFAYANAAKMLLKLAESSSANIENGRSSSKGGCRSVGADNYSERNIGTRF